MVMTGRTLVILRHAKAAQSDGLADADRPLTERGRADAAVAGAWLAAQGYRPALVLCSPARRTRQTWHGVATALESAPLVRYEPQIYEGGTRELLTLLRAVEPELSTVLLIGHNPTVSLLSQQLGGDTVDSDGLRTTGLAVHAVDAEWSALRSGGAPLVASHTARSPD